MINIKRTKCPKSLKDSPTQGKKFCDKSVVKAVWKMQSEKCCYCERLIPEDGHLKAVEHFKPQDKYNHLKNDWDNLLLACSQCNGKKSNKFPTMLTNNPNETKVIYNDIDEQSPNLIIDPTNEKINPEDHLTYCFDDTDDLIFCKIKAKNKSNLGEKTITTIKLDDIFLRKELIQYYLNTIEAEYRNLLIAKHAKNNGGIRRSLDIFDSYMNKNSQFAGFVREFARGKKLDKNFEIKIP